LKNRCAVLSLLWVCLLVAGCGGDDGPRPQVATAPNDDAELADATRRARAEVNQLINALNQPLPGQRECLVLVAITDDRKVEHMWLNHLQFDGAAFHGRIAGEPVTISTVRQGQNWSVAPGNITDWVIRTDTKVIGGYTLRILESRLSGDERAAFE